MKRSRHTEEQVAYALRQAEVGTPGETHRLPGAVPPGARSSLPGVGQPEGLGR
jgi:hypothetical protein